MSSSPRLLDRPGRLGGLSVWGGLALAGVAAAAVGCGGGCKPGPDHRGVACRAALARETLTYGMSHEEALEVMGSADVAAPWQNDWGAGPATISNPYDTREVTSAIGEQYLVTRYFVRADGDGHCPLVRGRLDFQPLIFFDGELVGWSWGYLEDVLAKPVGEGERVWRFGEFCGAAASGRGAETNGSTGTK